MPEKISVEEEKKIMPSTFIDKLEGVDVIDPNLSEIKKDVVNQLKTLRLSMGQDLVILRDKSTVIDEMVTNELFNDLYQEDPVTTHILDYITISNNYNIKQTHFIQILCDGFVEFIQKLNDIGFRPLTRTEFIDEPLMVERERESFMSKVTQFVLMWKQYGLHHNITKQKILGDMIYSRMADTKEKFRLADDKFYEMTGLYILSTIKKDKEKAKEKRKQEEDAKKEKQEKEQEKEVVENQPKEVLNE